MKPRRAAAFRAFAHCIHFAGGCALIAASACAPSTPRGEDDDPFAVILERRDLQQQLEAGFDRRPEALIEALADADAAGRATAAYALASVRDPAARPALTARLRDDDAGVRGEAAFALGQLRDMADGPVLLDALTVERDSTVRLRLLEAIGKSGNATALDRILGGDVPQGTALAVSLFHFGRRGVTDTTAGRVLLAMAASDDERQAATAALALAAGRDVARWGVLPGDVRRLITSGNVDRAALPAFIDILARESDPADRPLFEEALTEAEDWRVRRAAAAALGAQTVRSPSDTGVSSAVTDALFLALDDASPHVAVTAAGSLVRLSLRSRVTAGAPANASNASGAAPTAPSPPAPDPLSPSRLSAWIVAHAAERPPVAAALLPALVGTTEEAVVVGWARGIVGADLPPEYAFPALAMIGSAATDSILLAGLRGERRVSYAAAAALADRLEDLPADAPLRNEVFQTAAPVVSQWGPHAPGSDLRGLLRLVEDAVERDEPAAHALVRAASSHAAPAVREAARAAARSALLPRRKVEWDRLRAAGPHPRLEFETSRGSFEVVLDAARAPLSVSAIMAWAEAGVYDALTFHRVEPDFILQSGDIRSSLGYGGPERGLRSEITHLPFAPGVFGVASAGDDTEGSQYFITHSYEPSLDGRYSAVGRVVSGRDVAESVALGDSVLRVTPVW